MKISKISKIFEKKLKKKWKILNVPLTDNKLHFEFRFGIHYIWYEHVTKILAIWLAETDKQRIKFFEIGLFHVFNFDKKLQFVKGSLREVT